MTRKWCSYLLLILAVSLLSCTKGLEFSCPFIKLTVISDDSPNTKAPADGIDIDYQQGNYVILRENKIDYVDFFFYPGGDTEHDATYHKRVTSGKNKSDVFRLDLGADLINHKIFPYSDTEDIQTCRVFAVVNCPDVLVADENNLANTSLPELKSKTITTDFIFPDRYDDHLTSKMHSHKNFMMSGEVTMRLNGRSMVMASSATIEAVRYASKLTVGVNVADEVISGNDTWMPMLEGMQVYLVNAVNTVTLGGPFPNPRDPDPDHDVDGEYFSFKENPMPFAYKQNDELKFYFDKTGDYYNTYPFYMYPQQWSHSSSIAPTKEPFLKLIIPFVRVVYDAQGVPQPQSQKQFYYKVVIPDDVRDAAPGVNPSDYLCHFVRNNWYHVNIDVGILGAETDEAEVETTGSVYVVYWQDKNVVVKNAEIGKARYLSVDKEEYEIHNVTDLTVPYTSSHPITIENVIATRPFYGDVPNTDLTLPESDPDVCRGPGNRGFVRKVTDDPNDHGRQHGYEVGSLYLDFSTEATRLVSEQGEVLVPGWISMNEDASEIHFHHTIENHYTEKTFDYAPYTVSFSVEHADLSHQEYRKNIKIVQLPGIYIKVWNNSDSNNSHNGYVYIDGAQYKRTKSYDIIGNWYKNNKDYKFNTNSTNNVAESFSRLIPEMQDLQWRVINYTGGSKALYRIDVSVLPEDSDFVIGDARMTTVDNLEDENSFLGKKRFHGQAASDGDVVDGTWFDHYPNPTYPEASSNFWKTWSESAWQSVYDGFGSPKPVEASVPYSWPEEHHSAWTLAPSIEDPTGQRTLQHYYPADPSERTANLMAPSYLIASKYGGVEYYRGTYYEEAVYRCAAYQEDGYPAGRWRLPTRGEIKFIAMLSANKAFTFLFSEGGYYWSANGAVKVVAGGVEDVNEEFALGRCVYDIWYWGEQDQLTGENRKVFTWGDRER